MITTVPGEGRWQAQYELKSIERLPHAERWEGFKELRRDLAEGCVTTCQAVQDVIAGEYGYGFQQLAEEILETMGDPSSRLYYLATNLRFRCGETYASRAFCMLDQPVRTQLQSAINTVAKAA